MRLIKDKWLKNQCLCVKVINTDNLKNICMLFTTRMNKYTMRY